MVIKIERKNQTTRLFLEILNVLSEFDKPYLVTCEKDSSGDRDVSWFIRPGHNVLTMSNAISESGKHDNKLKTQSFQRSHRHIRQGSKISYDLRGS